MPLLRPPPPVSPTPPPGLVIAHRAGLGHAPENSLLAIRTAAAKGADAVELDVRAVAHELICAHDRGQPGPRAVEAVELALGLGMRVELDLKSPGHDRAVVRVAELLDRLDAHDRVWVSTFQPLAVWRLRHLDPRLVVGWSIQRSAVERATLSPAWARWVGAQLVEPEFGLVTPERLARWHGTPLVVEAWAIPPAEVQGCLDRGMSVVVDHLE
jgi:glycerophosphoryl diester phosphodiesterase